MVYRIMFSNEKTNFLVSYVIDTFEGRKTDERF